METNRFSTAALKANDSCSDSICCVRLHAVDDSFGRRDAGHQDWTTKSSERIVRDGI